MKKAKIKINNKEIICASSKTIMEVAKENGIEIPGLCNHPDFSPKANCRICVVEIKGIKKLMTSCSTKVQDGMEVKTNTERVKRVRNLNIELIFAEHIEKCPDCIWNVNCKLLSLANKYDIKIKRFTDRKDKRKIYKFANAVEIDGTQCIDCRNCIDACSILQNINYLKLKGKGAEQEVVPNKKIGDKKIDCIYCGQCTVHCPVGAAQEQSHWEKVEKFLYDKSKIVIAQFAPAIRVSIGEEFGLPYGKIATGQVVAGLKKLGFDHVFDVNFGADITTIIEARELLERLEKNKNNNKTDKKKLETGNWKLNSLNKKTVPSSKFQVPSLPMITSCCPAWVKYVEFYHPELIPNLTTSRSPHIHLGGIIKTYWAERKKVKPENIVVVSVMPCTAKKFESTREELKVKNASPVDYVLTTREFAWMMKRRCVDFAKIKGVGADCPLGEHSGAAAIYGGSGGVMESALRSARFFACAGDKKKESEICKLDLDFKAVRGLENIKETMVVVAGAKLRIAVVNGIGNIEQVIENLNNYDYIEVMACPGGCIGGGGQPIPTTDEIRKKRIEALYQIDKNKKNREAHRNEGVLEVLEWLEGQGKLEHSVLHTEYGDKF
ncbi:MAG: [Fe-Fe] hydrogenase large subunit C-terminal domain-containing protein [Patescibacteria group bacterium]|nr:[Fe-Fe] hydrogenase large subunit C-terminal domain-containing protein [Patescibacteria group bacterium]